MSAFWTPDSLRAAAGGTWLSRGEGGAPGTIAEVAGVSIDSRTIKAGEAYVAIKGERFDGQDFVRDAVGRGAAMVFVERAGAASAESLAGPRGPVPAVKVADARRALLRLGKMHRRSFEAVRVVAVTGSNGKTTTSRLIDAILATKWKGSCSQKSFNNEIGVPLTLLRVRKGEQYVVCEVGMNAPGEIAPLADAIEPDAAVITSVGRAHMEALGSVEAVAKEKASLLVSLRQGGTAIVPSDSPLLEEYLRGLANVIRFGRGENADLRVTEAAHATLAPSKAGVAPVTGVRFTLNGRFTYEVPLVGLHNATNAAAAIAVGRRFGLDDEQIRAGLRGATPAEMRLQRRTIAGVDVLNDAYNANPESTIAGLGAFIDLARDARRRTLVLGDMRELGPHAAGAHTEVAEAILALEPPGLDLVITVGEAALHTARRLLRDWPPERVATFSDAGDGPGGGASAIAALLRPGDSALLKGSRGVGLERVEHALAAREKAQPDTFHARSPVLR